MTNDSDNWSLTKFGDENKSRNHQRRLNTPCCWLKLMSDNPPTLSPPAAGAHAPHPAGRRRSRSPGRHSPLWPLSRALRPASETRFAGLLRPAAPGALRRQKRTPSTFVRCAHVFTIPPLCMILNNKEKMMIKGTREIHSV